MARREMAGKTRGGSVSGKRMRVVDPMLVSSRVAEENNVLLDGELADLEERNEVASVGFDEFDEFDGDLEFGVAEINEDGELVEGGSIDDDCDVRGVRGAGAVTAGFCGEDGERKVGGDLVDDSGKKKKEPKLKKNGKPKMKLWKKITIGVVLVIVAVGSYLAWYALSAVGKLTETFSGDMTDIFRAEPLKKDENGRTNILVFGTSEDEEGHGGAMLADSILVLSVDQEKKDAKTFSIPRDLWVNYTVAGEDSMYCSVGYKGKINAEYMCALAAFDDDPHKASQYFAKKVTEVTGVDIQYYLAVDWTVLITLVDAVGGIDVDVWATEEEGISDVCQQIRMPKGMNYGIDGQTALKLARARGACYVGDGNITVNFGLANSNFDREKNQQRIITAIKEKALNLGVLADPNKVLTILDSLGKNVKTNISLSEVRTALDIALGLEGEIASIETQDQFSTGNVNGASSVVPKGAPLDASAPALYDYTELREYFTGQLKRTAEEPAVSEESEGVIVEDDEVIDDGAELD